MKIMFMMPDESLVGFDTSVTEEFDRIAIGEGPEVFVRTDDGTLPVSRIWEHAVDGMFVPVDKVCFSRRVLERVSESLRFTEDERNELMDQYGVLDA